MPSKEQLEELNDQLLSENESLRRQLDEASEATEQVQTLEAEGRRLREELERSERERTHAAQMLTSLTAAQSGIEQIFRAKEETALQRLEIESAKLAERKQRITKWSDELEVWKDKTERENEELKAKARQCEGLTSMAQREVEEARRVVQEREGRIGRIEAEAQKLRARIAELEKKPGWLRGMEWVGAHPMFWLGVIGIAAMVWLGGTLYSRAHDWMWPSSAPPAAAQAASPAARR
jgi:chromosome segregation protein